MIQIQKRDREILKVCYEQQFILTEHLREHFFDGNYVEAKRRVIELRKSNFLKNGAHKIGKKSCLVLDDLGLEIAKEESPFKLPKSEAPDEVLLQHDAIVTSVRLQLEKRWDAAWIPERAIRDFHLPEVPDGILQFENGQKVAVEIENSLKGKARFINRLKAWGAVKVRLVLFVATSADLYLNLKRFLEGAPNSPAFGLTTLESLQSKQPRVWSPMGELDLFSRRIIS